MSSIWTIRRSTSDVKLAGLCGGVARHWGIDPVLVRVGWALLALSGGIGVILYVAGWLLLPVEGKDKAPAEDMFGDTLRKWPREVWVAIVVMACVAGFALFRGISPFSIGPAVVVAADLVLRLLQGSGCANAGPASPPPPAVPPPPVVPSATPAPRPPSPRRLRPGSGGSPSTRPAGDRSPGPAVDWPAPGNFTPPPAPRPLPARSGRRPGPGRRPGAVQRRPSSPRPTPWASTSSRRDPASGAAGPSRAATVRSPAALGRAAGPGADHVRSRHRGLPGRRHPPRRVCRRGLLVVGIALVLATWLGRARGLLPVGVLLAVAVLVCSAPRARRIPGADPPELARSRTSPAQFPPVGMRWISAP